MDQFSKKKIETEFEYYFPEKTNTQLVEYYQKLALRAKFQCEQIIEGNTAQRDAQIQAIEDFLFSTHKPQNFAGKQGLEVQFVKGFEETCTIIEQYSNKDPKTMTTLEYYQKLEFIKKQIQKNKKR